MMREGKCCALLTVFVFGGAVVTWIAFSVIALTNESDTTIRNKCETSNLWACLCAMTVITGVNLLINMNSGKSDEKKNSNLFAACFSLAGFIWMAVELFQPCPWNNLRESQVWTMLVALFGMEVTLLGLFILFGCILCGIKSLSSEKEALEDEIV